MAPRAYTLGRRAETASGTRQRIIDAAAELYRARGVAATTLQAVAERADVSRGTIINHFGGNDALVEAVAQHVIVSLELPDERIFEGVAGREARIRRFIDAIVRFFERSGPWWQAFASEMRRPALQEMEAEYWAVLGRLQAAALGPDVSGDRISSAAVDALIHPATLGAYLWRLQEAGLSLDEVIEVIGDLVVGIVERATVGPANI